MSAAAWRTRPRKLLSGAVAVAVLLALLWGAGFAWFLRGALTAAAPPPQADGIVALTGGAGRVESALHLLAEGRARLLLVSGVGGAAEFSQFAHLAGVDAHLHDRVTLGRAAASTRGNAAETADWAHGNGIRSLIVVTAGYHMPRALAELGRALPDVALYPAPVLPPALRDGANEAAMLRLLAGEYTKWLATEVGLSALDLHGGLRPYGRAEPERRG
jgi:uncharacterized SAM-binding protein YcdF (DUF218 family)